MNTKLDVKKLIPRAHELYENGENEEALKLYRLIHRVYTRSSKASDKKIILIGQKIGILVALQGKYEAAINWLLRSYDDVTKLKDDKLPFVLYYDMCIM
ncbi:MAG: tetratricopeptide repeat protein, partial [Flavobacteriales bacterium]